MPYNSVADSFHINAADFLPANSIFFGKDKIVVFETPFGDLGAT